MKKKVKNSDENLPEANQNKISKTPDNLMRRDALKRMAYLAFGGITGSAFLNSCDPTDDYSDYSDYSDYYNYYSRYSRSYYDYYSRYSVYWD